MALCVRLKFYSKWQRSLFKNHHYYFVRVVFLLFVQAYLLYVIYFYTILTSFRSEVRIEEICAQLSKYKLTSNHSCFALKTVWQF